MYIATILAVVNTAVHCRPHMESCRKARLADAKNIPEQICSNAVLDK